MTKILLVEDDKSLREIYGVRLLAEGYDIVSAGDGEEALAMAIKERPQLIVSDVMMPKISGFDMLDILRSTTETKAIKVIMMTALSSEDQRARGEALGADRYLVKSQVGIEDVVRTVHDVLGDALTGIKPSAFGSASVPSATPRPAPTTTAPPRPLVTPAPTMPSPTVATPAQTAPQIQQRPTMPAPVATPAPQASTLPQPTAPFSTNRPANLGERVIHPIAPTPAAAAAPDLGSLIDQELGKLNNQQPEPAATAPIAPTPVPQPVATTPMPTPPPAPEPQLVIP
ncbi:MAG: hypothetical protein JWO61_63, partial [Candidatus Saccharibacteria bacterium]|nr:hypothetical protein [Candidatus Saccharibacteria bacterium]